MSSKKKYCIYQNGQFLGYHGGSSPAKAIEKMSKSFYPVVYKIDFNDYFDIYYGSDYSQIYVGEA